MRGDIGEQRRGEGRRGGESHAGKGPPGDAGVSGVEGAVTPGRSLVSCFMRCSLHLVPVFK